MDNLGAYIGLGIVTIGVAILWFLADKPHHKQHSHSKAKTKLS